MRVIVSAGGTGGHIYPAIAIINKIKEEEPNSEILYIGTSDRMEKDLIPELGIKYQEITVSGLKRKLTLENFKVLYQFLCARNKCKIYIFFRHKKIPATSYFRIHYRRRLGA